MEYQQIAIEKRICVTYDAYPIPLESGRSPIKGYIVMGHGKTMKEIQKAVEDALYDSNNAIKGLKYNILYNSISEFSVAPES